MAATEERELNDYETAEAIRDGKLPSPTAFKDGAGQTSFWLFDMRITGTGAAWRAQHEEWAYRDPKEWTSDEFLKRCHIPVIFEHPEEGGLNSDEWKERSIGTIMLPYVKGEEVWGIAKIFDADAAELMQQKAFTSTSPGVTPGRGSTAVSLESGEQVLAEGLPFVLDHLAVCELGVWDKDGPPAGVRLDSLIGKGEVVSKTVEELERELRAATTRADAAEKEREDEKARADKAEDELEKEREDAKRKDEDEKEAVRAAEKAKDDARKKRHDEGKHDGKHNDCAKCDAFEEKGEVEEKKDGAPLVNVNANAEEEVADARRDSKLAELESSNKTLLARVEQLIANQQPPSNDDAAALAEAWSRADSVFPMLGEKTPRHYPGEKPSNYRRRLADALRPFTKSFKDEPIHDSATGKTFELAEDLIYSEAIAEAKNPSLNDSVGRLIEHTRTVNGKTYREFVGDASVAWAPFAPQVGMRIKFTKQNREAR